MVQGGVAWFEPKGTQSLKIPITITEKGRNARGMRSEGEEKKFAPLNGLKKSEFIHGKQ